jgi:hypothetical protein
VDTKPGLLHLCAVQVRYIFNSTVQVSVILHSQNNFISGNKEITSASDSGKCTEILDTGSFSECLSGNPSSHSNHKEEIFP